MALRSAVGLLLGCNDGTGEGACQGDILDDAAGP